MSRCNEKSKLTGFGQSVFEFNSRLIAPPLARSDFQFINPFMEEVVVNIQHEFCSRYYRGKGKRLGIFGINPGRLGAGITGIPFTDPRTLKHICGIETLGVESGELSSEFVYSVIESMGDVKTFYQKFYIGSVCPLGLLINNRNANYYDSTAWIQQLRPWIAKCMKAQIDMGLRRDAVIILGTGKNAKFFTALNHEFSFFERVFVLEHPRYIMQYKRRDLQRFREIYKELLFRL